MEFLSFPYFSKIRTGTSRPRCEVRVVFSKHSNMVMVSGLCLKSGALIHHGNRPGKFAHHDDRLP
jgi:hypothetical protein